MTEIFCFILGAAAAFYFSERKKPKEKQEEKFIEEEGESNLLSPMALRNGYKVTKNSQPTFAEQWVNIINYCGESQLEEDYEEDKREKSAEHLGRIS